MKRHESIKNVSKVVKLPSPKVTKIYLIIIKLLRRMRLIGIVRSLCYRLEPFNPLSISHKGTMKQLYLQFIKKGDLCFDVGANVGNKTKIFLELGARVVCIEPCQVCLRQLYKSFGNNKNVIIVPKGVTDKEGFAELSICEDTPTISTMSERYKEEGRWSRDYRWTKNQEVPVTTLDALISQYGLPVFCKIDVEGFEETVLKRLTKPIPFISFEFHRELFDEMKKSIEHLLSIGRVEFNCSLYETNTLLSPTWLNPYELSDKLVSLEDPFLWGDIFVKFL